MLRPSHTGLPRQADGQHAQPPRVTPGRPATGPRADALATTHCLHTYPHQVPASRAPRVQARGAARPDDPPQARGARRGRRGQSSPS